MKPYIKYLTIVIFLLTTLSACNRVDEKESNFTNVAYIEAAKNTRSEYIALRNKDTHIERNIQSALALPIGSDVNINYKIDFSLVEDYNATSTTKCEALPDEFFEISETKAIIPAGEVRSTSVLLTFKGLDNLPRTKTFILPVTIENASNVDVLKGSKTYYYLLRKGAPITTAANIEDTGLYAPSGLTNFNGLSKVTMEALVRANKWGGPEAGISTLMGIEGYFLIRFGDSSYEDQIQVATGSSFGGNWPAKNAAFRLPKDQWLHIALTYDLGTHEMILYVNGKVQAKDTRGSASSMNLASNFFIGKSYSDKRPWNGAICEARIWNVVRTQEQLNASKYEVASDSEGLLAYWKFDEGEGNVINDYTNNGNNLTLVPKENGSTSPVKWMAVELGEE